MFAAVTVVPLSGPSETNGSHEEPSSDHPAVGGEIFLS